MLTVTVRVAPAASVTTTVPVAIAVGPGDTPIVKTLPLADAERMRPVVLDVMEAVYGPIPPEMLKLAAVPAGTVAVKLPPAITPTGVAGTTVTTITANAPAASVTVTKAVPAVRPFMTNALGPVIVTVATLLFELTALMGAVPPVIVWGNCVPAATDTLVEGGFITTTVFALVPQPNGATPDSETGMSVNATLLLMRTSTTEEPPTPFGARVTVSIPFVRSAVTLFGSSDVADKVRGTPGVLFWSTKAEADEPQATGPNVAGVRTGDETPMAVPIDGPVDGPNELLMVKVAVRAVASRTTNETPVEEQILPVVMTCTAPPLVVTVDGANVAKSGDVAEMV